MRGKGVPGTVFYREMETVVPDDHKDVLLFLYILLPGSNSIIADDPKRMNIGFCRLAELKKIPRAQPWVQAVAENRGTNPAF